MKDIRATRTRPYATTAIDPNSSEPGYEPRASTAELPKLRDIVGEHYRLVRELGEGNFGKVYVAERVDVPEHQVALKIMPRSFYTGRNVERELIMLAQASHPNLVQLKDHGMTDDYVWLTMPVYVGETLDERIQREPLDLREAYDIFVPIARALEALHMAGLRHQDVKPENIFLARFGGRLHPVLLDLGVAAEKESAFIAGTALFAAPEQLLAILGAPGAIPLTEKMDTYCLGTTLLMALVGDKRFPGAKARSREDIVSSHAERATDPLGASLPRLAGPAREMLEEALKSFMALAPKDRPTMAGVAERLDVLLEEERELEREEVRAKEAARRSLLRSRIGTAVFLVLAVALAGAALYKRETLRLASQLENARAEGAQSFDKLDTCVASYDMERANRISCESDRTREQTEHEDTVQSLSRANSCAELSTELTDTKTRLLGEVKVCKDDLKEEKTTCETQKTKLSTDYGAERTQILHEKADCEEQRDARETDLATMRKERDAHEAEKLACIADRAALRVQNAPAIPTVSPGTAPKEPTGSNSPTPAPAPTDQTLVTPSVSPQGLTENRL